MTSVYLCEKSIYQIKINTCASIATRMYVCSSHIAEYYSKDRPGKVANPARGHLNIKMNISFFSRHNSSVDSSCAGHWKKQGLIGD